MLPPGMIHSLHFLLSLATRTRTVPFVWSPDAQVLKLGTVTNLMDRHLTKFGGGVDILFSIAFSVWYAHYAATRNHVGGEQLTLIIIWIILSCIPPNTVACHVFQT